MSEVRNGEQKGHKDSYFEIFYGGQKLHRYFCYLMVRGTALTQHTVYTYVFMFIYYVMFFQLMASLLTCSYIGEVRNGWKLKCENESFIVFILILRRVLSYIGNISI